ncbi:translation initiation factor eIF-2B subunit delta [Topomyia yanbarensis]|uniref:translation initiation factor eIF-2B subunit delta n=1 Tax=Topomyia yanbarensis TaxID=2498891 RepID=UPI00273B75E2|nr:translation initiation factor eIF-2B subunit delta [Topomyia yanbarensis]
METPEAPSKQKRRPRKNKPKQASVQEVLVQHPISLQAVPITVLSKSTTKDKENIHTQDQQNTTEFNRNASKRRRKRNRAKKTELGELVKPISLEEIFPGAKIYNIENQTIPKKGIADKTQKSGSVPRQKDEFAAKNCSVVDITAELIFPTLSKLQFPTKLSPLRDIPAEEIFPSSTVYDFDNNTIPRKLKSASFQQNIERRKSPQSIPGIVNIPLEQIFPFDQHKKLHPLEKAMNPPQTEKSREEILAEREAKKAAKAAAKGKNKDKSKSVETESIPLQKSNTDNSLSEKLAKLHISEEIPSKPNQTQTLQVADKTLSKAERKALFEAQNLSSASVGAKGEIKPATTKAERRALQEAQRAAKAEAQAKKAAPPAKENSKPDKPIAKISTPTKQVKKSPKATDLAQQPHMVKLFNHLYTKKFAASEIVNSTQLHSAITTLGLQYAEGVIAGSKARCLAFLQALTQMIQDYETPPEKEFSRGFEEALNPNIAHLQKCRPFSVSMTNALKYIKMYTRQLNAKDSDSDQKEFLLDAIDTYVRDQIEKAEEAISISVQEKIYDGDVILTYGCSSLIKHILEEANRRQKSFRVVIVDSRPRNREHEMLRQLVAQGIDCTCVLINAISYVMPEVTKVLLSAHALLANGCVMSRVGTAQIALVAKSFNVPVLVCCETHKFSERVQTDAFVYNEIGNPNDLILSSGTRENRLNNPLAEWESISNLTPLNLHYDVTPPELVTAVVTEVAILPCTSVPVILRIKPSEVGY